MQRRIILVGKGGAGKDFLRRKLESRGFTYQISYTTRPARLNEMNGVDYWFITEKEAEQIQWKHVITFNNWKYGTTLAQFYATGSSCSVFIMTPTAIKTLSAEDRKGCFIIYVNPPQSVIEERLKKRAMPGDSFERRIQSDKEQFAQFSDYDITITNPDF